MGESRQQMRSGLAHHREERYTSLHIQPAAYQLGCFSLRSCHACAIATSHIWEFNLARLVGTPHSVQRYVARRERCKTAILHQHRESGAARLRWVHKEGGCYELKYRSWLAFQRSNRCAELVTPVRMCMHLGHRQSNKEHNSASHVPQAKSNSNLSGKSGALKFRVLAGAEDAGANTSMPNEVVHRMPRRIALTMLQQDPHNMLTTSSQHSTRQSKFCRTTP